jgi:phosphonate dehydrogenase
MSLPRVVIGQRVFPETLALLAPHAEVIAPVGDLEALPPAELRRALATADAWMAFMPDQADAALLEASPRLRLIAGALKGGDNFDVQACSRRGVWFSLVPDLLTTPTAELTIGLMIGLGRRLVEGDQQVRSGQYAGWRPQLYGAGLEGARVGYVGFGAIGRAIARRLRGFELEQRYFDPSASAAEGLDTMREADLPRLLAWADYVVLAAPLTPGTQHIIDAKALAHVQPHALLINPARGSLVDEAAVLAALQTGRLGGYAADVFEFEDWARPDRPHAIAPELLAHPATLFSPHLGSAVVAVRQAIERRAAENILDLLTGRAPRDAINHVAPAGQS